MAQFGRPISDLQNTSITNGFGSIDETSPSDGDFLYSADNVNTVYECGLTTSLGDPITGSDHIIRYRIAEIDGGVLGDGAGNGTVTVATSLRQGATIIATDTTRNCTNAWTTYTLNLSTTEANNITDYTDLRLFFDITSPTGGSPSGRRGAGVSWGEFESPERITVFDESIELSSNNTISDSATMEMTSSISLSIDNTFTDSVGLSIDESIILSSDNTLTDLVDILFDLGITLNSDNLIINTNTVDFNTSVIISADNTLADQSIFDMEDFISLNINNIDIYIGAKEYNDTISISSDNTITIEGIITTTYNVSVSLNAHIKLDSRSGKSGLFTMTNINLIKNIGKIK